MRAAQSRSGPWMGVALLGGLALATASLMLMGTAHHRGTLTALQMTARWAYGFFWPAYVGGALATLFGPRFQPLARHGRVLGLAFAAAMLAHVAMIVRIYAISTGPVLPLGSVVFFGVGLVFAYVLALFSIPTLSARLPARARRLLFTVGMEYIGLAFLRDFLHDPFNGSMAHLVGYLPFIVLALSGLLLRIIVHAQRLRRWIGQFRTAQPTRAAQAPMTDANR